MHQFVTWNPVSALHFLNLMYVLAIQPKPPPPQTAKPRKQCQVSIPSSSCISIIKAKRTEYLPDLPPSAHRYKSPSLLVRATETSF